MIQKIISIFLTANIPIIENQALSSIQELNTHDNTMIYNYINHKFP